MGKDFSCIGINFKMLKNYLIERLIFGFVKICFSFVENKYVCWMGGDKVMSISSFGRSLGLLGEVLCYF